MTPAFEKYLLGPEFPLVWPRLIHEFLGIFESLCDNNVNINKIKQSQNLRIDYFTDKKIVIIFIKTIIIPMKISGDILELLHFWRKLTVTGCFPKKYYTFKLEWGRVTEKKCNSWFHLHVDRNWLRSMGACTTASQFATQPGSGPILHRDHRDFSD